jgi:hypothetical protein
MSDELLRQLTERVERTIEQQRETAQILRDVADQVKGHTRTLYGEDGRDGLSGDVTVLRTTQEQCPARQAHELGHQQSGVSNVVAIVGLGLATLLSLVGVILQVVLR